MINRTAHVGVHKPHIRFKWGSWWVFTRAIGGFYIGKGPTIQWAWHQWANNKTGKRLITIFKGHLT